jgi:hypothetical protein
VREADVAKRSSRVLGMGASPASCAGLLPVRVQALRVVLHGTPAQGKQGQSGFLGRHHLALGEHQLVELQAHFGQRRKFQPTLARLDQGGSQHAALHAGGLGRFAQGGPGRLA